MNCPKCGCPWPSTLLNVRPHSWMSCIACGAAETAAKREQPDRAPAHDSPGTVQPHNDPKRKT